MRRPLMPLVVAFLAGIATARFVPLPSSVWLLGTLLIAGLALLSTGYGRTRLATLALLGLFFALGAGRLDVVVRLPPLDHVDRLPAEVLEEPLQLEGVVTSPTDPLGGEARGLEPEDERARFLLDLERIWLDGREVRVRGRVRLTLVRPAILPEYGDRLRGTFTIRRPRGFLNPGGFDYALYLGTMGVGLEGWAREGQGLERLGRGEGHRLIGLAYALRGRMVRAISQLLAPDRAALLAAITLGERSGIDRRVQEAFLGSGTYHILAISGLNVSLLAATVFIVLRALRVPRRMGAVLSGCLVTFYAALAGGSPSVVRAAVMADLYLLALILDREADSWNTLAVSAFLLLLWQPRFLFDAGFQLTFVATAAILVAAQRLPVDRLRPPWRWVAAPVLVSTAAFLGTAPILAATFHRVSPVALVANLPVVPLSGLLTGAGMLFALLAMVVPGSLGPFAALIGALVDLLVGVAAWFARLPFATVPVFPPSVPMMLSYYAALGAAAWAAGGRRQLRWGAALASLLCVLLIGIRFAHLLTTDRLRMTVLDVGQGDAILLELPGRRVVLIDGGGLFDDRFDIGGRVVVPVLLSRWISRVDVVVLSHPHPDHLNGLKAVLRQVRVGEVWDGGQRASAPTYVWLQETLRQQRIPHKILEAGHVTDAFHPVEIAVLHPPPRLLRGSPRGPSSDVNSNSLVLRLRYRDVRILLPGDIEDEAERLLLDRGAEVSAQVLKVPHHGGRTSSGPLFLARVRPTVAIVSAGHRNRFGHPHQETLERYRAIGARLFRTDLDGAVTVTTDGTHVEVATMRASHGRLGGWP